MEIVYIINAAFLSYTLWFVIDTFYDIAKDNQRLSINSNRKESVINKKVTVGKWSSEACCVSCHHTLSCIQEYNANGVCAHCGIDSKSTIVDSYRRVFRENKITTGPWYHRITYNKIEYKDIGNDNRRTAESSRLRS